MLLSDTWQPAVLQLLPFSSNDACNPQAPSSSSSSSARLRSLPTPDHSRGFPVLAVTRREKEGGASDPALVSSTGGRGHGALGAGPSQSMQASRAVSERLTRSQTVLDPSCIPPRSRAKSEYVNRRSGTTAAAGHRSRSSAGAESSREQVTCSITDINERIMSRTQRADSSSPDSGTAPFVTSAAEGRGQGGGSGRGLPKPAFSTNAWSPVNSAAAGGIGGQGGSGVEGRYLVSKNGLWRSVTLTPGELELKKHRDQLEKVTSGKQTASGDKMSGRRYHKMNIRDLPRSTTPLTDHDPDKLNMKQVIAFLQSKGKSQADAVELPREVRLKVQQSITFQRTSRSGAMRGSVRKATASSTAAELTFRASLRQAAVAAEAGEASRPSASSASHRTEGGGGEATRSSGRVHGARGSADNRSVRRSWGSSSREQSQERPDRSPPPPPPASARKMTQKKPFRLHRFLTMVPSAREPAFYSSSSSPSSTSSPSSSSPALYSRSAYPTTNTATAASSSSSLTNGRIVLYPAGSLEAGPSRSAQKERTLCLDLASQSKSQTGQAKGENSRSHTAGPRRAGVGQGGSEGRVQYRVPASRPRPSSLRVEQDASETQWKLAADFGERDSSSRVVASAADLTDEAFRQEKNVIRLPFVLVDSEDEDVGVAELKRPSKPQVAKSAKSSKSSRVKFESTAESWVTDAEAGEAGGGEGMEGEGGGRRGEGGRGGEGGGGRGGEGGGRGGGRGEGGGEGGRERTPQVMTDAPAENPSSQTSGFPSSLPPARTKSANNNNNNKNKNNNSSLVTDAHSDTLSDHVHMWNSPEEDKLPEVVTTQASLLVLASAGRLADVAGTKPHAAVLAASSSAKRVNVNVPAARGEHGRGGDDVSRHRTTPEYVTLSLRKEPHRTRERTYMSEIGGSDVFSDDTCAARANSESVRMSLKSDDMTSLAS